MQSISIAFKTDSISIPISYHHQVQALIYKLLAWGGNHTLHDQKLEFGLREYKLFTFSSLRGGKVSHNRKLLCFDHRLFLDVRSIRPEFCQALLSGLKTATSLDLFGQPLSVSSVKTSKTSIRESQLAIKMLSPLTLHRTAENGYTEYLNPLDSDFSQELNDNFVRKYSAFYGQKPTAKINLEARSIRSQDKYLTLYKKSFSGANKDIYITGWRGEYELSGRPEHLTFLYYCGLGARNSDGFGMFERI